MSKLFVKCPQCRTNHFTAFLKKEKFSCSHCGHYFRMNTKQRIRMTCDKGSFSQLPEPETVEDPLRFPGYGKKLEKSRKQNGISDAIITGTARIEGAEVAMGVMEPGFIMASMGAAVGERICRLMDHAVESGLPVLLVVSSGGARMQEGIISLMQMAKTSASVAELHRAGLPLFTLLTDPTTGGVSASFAMLADVIMAEKGSLIGFAGPRVISQTIGQDLPKGFQRAEFLEKHGLVDLVVERSGIRSILMKLISAHMDTPYEKGGRA